MPLPSSKVTLIYNPNAGHGMGKGIILRAAEFWQACGWEIFVRPTSRTEHAAELAKHAAEQEHGLVLAAGGDGTLNEVANGLAHTQTALAPLPVGTANSFAKELRLPRPKLIEPDKLLDASRALMDGHIVQMDLGQCDSGRYWMLWSGAGADGFVVDQIEPRSKLIKRLGPAAYAAKALFFLPGFPSINAKITVDDQVATGEFLMITISNCRLFGGGELRLNAQAVLDDGVFEVWLFRGQQWPTVMRYVLEIGLDNHANDPNIEMLRGRSVSVVTNPSVPYHVDGERAGATPFSATIHQGALRLLAPSTAPPGLFNQVGEPLRQAQR
ncbi:MAG: diacylglycerol kinase family lipid kinase [Caldilineaceae bacterium]